MKLWLLILARSGWALMFKYLQVKIHPDKVVVDPSLNLSTQLEREPSSPLTIHQINQLPIHVKNRVYRALLPPILLAGYEIDPISWKGSRGDQQVLLKAEAETNTVSVRVFSTEQVEFIVLEFGDNAYNGIDLNLLVLNDPASPTYRTDYDDQGNPTLFGKARRNLKEDERAMHAGLAPGQVRKSLGASKIILTHFEGFLNSLGHRAFFLEPLTYASAWIFERRGFAYVYGHKLMDDIHKEFQPGGRLSQALDCSSPFRQPEQRNTVRGRAWAIQDGILEAIDAKWDKLRMVKRVGHHAGVDTFPEARY